MGFKHDYNIESQAKPSIFYQLSFFLALSKLIFFFYFHSFLRYVDAHEWHVLTNSRPASLSFNYIVDKRQRRQQTMKAQ